MKKVLEEQEVSLTESCDSTECAAEYGRMLSVEKIVVGSVSKVGDTNSVVIKLVNVGDAEVEKTGEARASKDEKNRFDLVEEAAYNLFE